MAIDSGSGGSCCREQRIEIDALRKRLAKVYKRLNIACKSSFSMEVQTVGHICKQNSGPEQLQLKLFSILYYQGTPLLKFLDPVCILLM